MKTDFDYLIIGMGAIGLAISYYLSKSNFKILNIDKEKTYGLGNSSRNTENIHSGIYYKNNSLKHKLCIRGKKLLYDFCEKHNIPYKISGKIFIATSNEEISFLESIHNQAKLNQINDIKELSENEINVLEPSIKAKCGILSPSSGVFDSYEYLNRLSALCENQGVTQSFKTSFIDSVREEKVWISTLNQNENFKIRTKNVINASGLYSTQISKKVFPSKKIPDNNPVKGTYYIYSDKSPINHIIYTPFEPGKISERIDATPNIHGKLIFGPSVEIAKNIEDFNPDPMLIDKFYNNIKKYFPSIIKSKLILNQCGIRPKIRFDNDKNPDFQFSFSENNSWLDLWGLESPALTASLAIGEYIDSQFNK
tara:strand:- start:24928 stop:26028 length:1101 start_codon:yes stop_codon:yes gene_type:complete